MSDYRDEWWREWDECRKEAQMNDRSVKTNFDMVEEFHKKFGLEYEEGPRDLPDDLALFRIGFLIEELSEYARASGFAVLADELDDEIIKRLKSPDWNLSDRSGPRDLEKQLDSLVDLNYVSDGTAYLHGFDFDEAYERVHNANMKKVRVDSETLEGSVRKSKFDVVKPEGWLPASLKDLVYESEAEEPVKEFPAVI